MQWRTLILTYLLPLMGVGLVTLGRQSLGIFLGETAPLLPYILAVLLAALLGGFWAGMLATVLSAVVSGLIFITPTRLSSEVSELIRMAIFLAEGVLISATFQVLHSRNQQLRQSQQQLEKAAITDALTGLRNRRAFEEDLVTELQIAQRTNQPLSLLVLDVDGLKWVNDQQGHAEGDRLLRLVAAILLENLRLSDRAYRLGGDEFAVILAGSTRTDLKTPLERLRDAFETLPQQGYEGAGVSMGTSSFPDEAPDGTALFRLADIRMYRQKKYTRPPTLS